MTFYCLDKASFIFSILFTITTYLIVGVAFFIVWSFLWFQIIVKIVFPYLKLYKAWMDFIGHRNQIKKWLKEGEVKVWHIPEYADKETAKECGITSGSLYRCTIDGKQQICIMP